MHLRNSLCRGEIQFVMQKKICNDIGAVHTSIKRSQIKAIIFEVPKFQSFKDARDKAGYNTRIQLYRYRTLSW